MSYDIGNLGLKGGSNRRKSYLYVAVAVIVIVVVVAALFLTRIL